MLMWGPEDRSNLAGSEKWPERAPRVRGFNGLLQLGAGLPGAVRRVVETGEPELLSYHGGVIEATVAVSDLSRAGELGAGASHRRPGGDGG
jgi:hypothetical protein